MVRKHVNDDSLPEGIVAMDENACFVGNAFEIDEWQQAMVWSPTEPEVEDSITKELETDSASGKALAVAKHEVEVEGWNKWLLTR